jgi:peroxiredoxin
VQTLADLPKDLPVPSDDGACDHLKNTKLPSIKLSTTNNSQVDFSSISGRIVIYLYPMTGRPDTALPGGWDEIPGARGCTPQSCSFRDHYSELKASNTSVYGLSTQNTDYQKEAANRLHLPFPLVSDNNLEFITSLNIPTIRVEGMLLSKRVTLIANDGIIEKVFYPVFPPNENANEVVAYLNEKGD